MKSLCPHIIFCSIGSSKYAAGELVWAWIKGLKVYWPGYVITQAPDQVDVGFLFEDSRLVLSYVI